MTAYTNNRVVQIDFDASVNEVLSGLCQKVILTATTACYVLFNKPAVTVVTGMYIPANIPVEVELSKIASISAIKSASAGKLTILELF